MLPVIYGDHNEVTAKCLRDVDEEQVCQGKPQRLEKAGPMWPEGQMPSHARIRGACIPYLMNNLNMTVDKGEKQGWKP